MDSWLPPVAISEACCRSGRFSNRRGFLTAYHVLVAHEAPECYWAPHQAAHARGLELGKLARSMGVGTYIHGHHHASYSLSWLDGRFTVHGLHKAEQPPEKRPSVAVLKDWCDEWGSAAI